MYAKFKCSTWLNDTNMEDPVCHMKKAFNHLMVKYSQDKNEIFSKPNATRKMINTLSLNLKKLLPVHGTSWIWGEQTGKN